MTGPGARLGDPGVAGTYVVEQGDADRYRAAADTLGFAVADVDLRGCRDKRGALGRIAVAWRFPDWFGGNWDALADCLGDLSWWPASGYLTVLEHAEELRAHAPGTFATLLSISDDAAAAWAAREVPYWTLLPVS